MSSAQHERTSLPRRCPKCGERFPLDYKVCPRDALALVLVETNDDPYIGSTLAATYRIDSLIAEGGMGRVYEAQHLRLPGRSFAIKILHRALITDTEVVSRFRREAEIVAAIEHPNVVRVHDVDTALDGTPFIVTERLVGEDLDQRLERVGRLEIPDAVHIIRQLCTVLATVHERGVLHRDLKPANLFLVGDQAKPTLKLIDFGIAKLHDPSRATQTQTGLIMGTPAYMAPEQARGAKVDARADLYAVGAIAYRCVTGHSPFELPDSAATLHAVLTSEPPRPSSLLPSIPAAFELVLQRSMARDPGERFPSLAELDAALASFAAPNEGASVSSALSKQTPHNIDVLTAIARRARPEIVITSVLALVIVTGGLADALAAWFSAAGLAVAAAFATVATPTWLYIRFLRTQIWHNSPRAVAWGRYLNSVVSVSGSTYAATFLCARLLDLSFGAGDGPHPLARILPWFFALAAALALALARRRTPTMREG